MAPSRSSPFASIPLSSGTARKLRNRCGARNRWLRRMARNVPPATTVASSPCSAFSASASASVSGASHSGARSDTGERLLVERARELAGPFDPDPVEAPAVLLPRPLLVAATLANPLLGHVLVRLEPRDRVGRLQHVGLVPPAELVVEDQAADLVDE